MTRTRRRSKIARHSVLKNNSQSLEITWRSILPTYSSSDHNCPIAVPSLTLLIQGHCWCRGCLTFSVLCLDHREEACDEFEFLLRMSQPIRQLRCQTNLRIRGTS